MPVDPTGHAVVLFDGTCAFCERSVRFIASRDPDGYFRFGASQSSAASDLLAAHGVSRQQVRSIVLVEGGRVFARSDATLRIAGRMPFPWNLAKGLLIVPRPVRDAAYAVVAAVRHRLSGPSNACDVPPPELKGRLL